MLILIAIVVVIFIILLVMYNMRWRCVDGKCEMTFTQNGTKSLEDCKSSCKEPYETKENWWWRRPYWNSGYSGWRRPYWRRRW